LFTVPENLDLYLSLCHFNKTIKLIDLTVGLTELKNQNHSRKVMEKKRIALGIAQRS
jgi:hypothetical protein